MIYGIGTDLVEVTRISKILEKDKDSFLKRICTPSEIETIKGLNPQKQAAALAKLFAAKEAVSKAFGTGIRGDISFANIEIIRDTLGKPSVLLHDTTKTYFNKNIKGTIYLSLSDEADMALAFAVISSN
ncbi:MAG: holo-ACP synthase [Alphaproteobacteria bacterium]|nr:holo-ACP synthase [Alphaproteobacteria bacterium]MBN2780139.1 holo-ACP synthase [Alphaproteobacteria bacterium]